MLADFYFHLIPLRIVPTLTLFLCPRDGTFRHVSYTRSWVNVQRLQARYLPPLTNAVRDVTSSTLMGVQIVARNFAWRARNLSACQTVSAEGIDAGPTHEQRAKAEGTLTTRVK